MPDDERENLEASGDVARVLRGGWFIDVQGSVRSVYRCKYRPDKRVGDVGFRVVVRISP
jgi:formylglycine-generating enzyme required for sulfatase activity